METVNVTKTMNTPPVQKRVRSKGFPTKYIRRSGRRMGLVRIGYLLEPLRQIINHPDRDRLIARFFEDD